MANWTHGLVASTPMCTKNRVAAAGGAMKGHHGDGMSAAVPASQLGDGHGVVAVVMLVAGCALARTAPPSSTRGQRPGGGFLRCNGAARACGVETRTLSGELLVPSLDLVNRPEREVLLCGRSQGGTR